MLTTDTNDMVPFGAQAASGETAEAVAALRVYRSIEEVGDSSMSRTEPPG
jgi:hypothetical protein